MRDFAVAEGRDAHFTRYDARAHVVWLLELESFKGLMRRLQIADYHDRRSDVAFREQAINYYVEGETARIGRDWDQRHLTRAVFPSSLRAVVPLLVRGPEPRHPDHPWPMPVASIPVSRALEPDRAENLKRCCLQALDRMLDPRGPRNDRLRSEGEGARA